MDATGRSAFRSTCPPRDDPLARPASPRQCGRGPGSPPRGEFLSTGLICITVARGRGRRRLITGSARHDVRQAARSSAGGTTYPVGGSQRSRNSENTKTSSMPTTNTTLHPRTRRAPPREAAGSASRPRRRAASGTFRGRPGALDRQDGRRDGDKLEGARQAIREVPGRPRRSSSRGGAEVAPPVTPGRARRRTGPGAGGRARGGHADPEDLARVRPGRRHRPGSGGAGSPGRRWIEKREDGGD